VSIIHTVTPTDLEINMEEVAPLLVTDIHKNFGCLEVLKGISAEAFKGDVISLIGASGSGKSTFLRCINLLETPTSGNIYVHGEAVKFTTNKKGIRSPSDLQQVANMRARLSMVFQGFNLWSHMTVLENIIEIGAVITVFERLLASMVYPLTQNNTYFQFRHSTAVVL
jgi:ABC-type histidine transport system ATPase subunit